MSPLLALLFVASLRPSEEMESIQCPNSSATGETKPLYLLALVPFPDTTSGAGWSNGLGALPGAIVARNEINNSTNLLPGYHIELIVEDIEACSRTQAAIGLVNLIKYIINPPCRPVTAVIGLLCSSHTALVAPVAGHKEIGLIQLSAANSPLFELRNNSFPHFWRFLSTGTVYADTTIAMMDRYGWSRIAIVHDKGSAFFTQISTYLQKRIVPSKNKSIIFNYALGGAADPYIFHFLDALVQQAATVLFVAINEEFTARLLCLIGERKLEFPAFVWIHVSVSLDAILRFDYCERHSVQEAIHGHIHLDLAFTVKEGFVQKYEEELKRVRIEYNNSLIHKEIRYSTNLYDEVWDFALAMNQSLPELKKRNLSIGNYTIGQPEVTEVIEKKMAMLELEGHLIFNEKKAVLSTVNVYQIIGLEESLVGNFSPHVNADNELVNYSLSSLDNFEKPYGDPIIEQISTTIPWAATLYTLSGLTFIYISVILILLICYRNKRELKAFSPCVSSLMLIGCYFIIFSAIIDVLNNHLLSDSNLYKIINSLSIGWSDFGALLIYSILALKMLRVLHIFTTWRVKCPILWRDQALVIYSVIFSFFSTLRLWELLPNVLTIEKEEHIIIGFNSPYVIRRQSIAIVNNVIPLVIVNLLKVFILIFILIVSVLTRHIKRKNFKDTKKVNILLTLVVIIDLFSAGYLIIPLSRREYITTHIISSVNKLVKVNLIVGFLFLPKIVPLFYKCLLFST